MKTRRPGVSYVFIIRGKSPKFDIRALDVSPTPISIKSCIIIGNSLDNYVKFTHPRAIIVNNKNVDASAKRPDNEKNT